MVKHIADMPAIKVNTLGGTGSGKTSIIQVLTGEWKGLTTSTTGINVQDPWYVSFSRQELVKENRIDVNSIYDAKFILWDIGAQTKYRNLLYDYLPGSYGQLCVIDGLNPRSCESLLSQLLLSVQVLHEITPLLILVNKKDLFEHYRKGTNLALWQTINSAMAAFILDSLELVDFPSENTCIMNYWILEQAIINGVKNRGGIDNLIEHPIQIPGSNKITLKDIIGTDNVKLIARYSLLRLLEEKKNKLFQGLASKSLQEIEFDRPGLIDSAIKERQLLIDASNIRKLTCAYHTATDKANSAAMALVISAISECYSGKEQVHELVEMLSVLNSDNLVSLAFIRYKQEISKKQAETIKNWLMHAKIYETTAIEPQNLKSIVLDFLYDVNKNFKIMSTLQGYDKEFITKTFLEKRKTAAMKK